MPKGNNPVAVSSLKKSLLAIFLVLIADQGFKFWVKTSFFLDERIPVLGDWFYLWFTENNGMAFGLEFDGPYGKLFLSLFRIVAVLGIAWYLRSIIKQKAPLGLIISISLIFAGAVGNIIDSSFYGMLFTDSYGRIAEFLPATGYDTFLYGKVVDMLYFPVLELTIPDWFPFWANENFVFFRPIFNIADTSITTGVMMILLFQKRYYPLDEKIEETEEENKSVEDSTESGDKEMVSNPLTSE